MEYYNQLQIVSDKVLSKLECLVNPERNGVFGYVVACSVTELRMLDVGKFLRSSNNRWYDNAFMCNSVNSYALTESFT